MAQFKQSDVKGKILTVNGLIEPNDLGKTICHEHLFIDFRVVYQAVSYTHLTLPTKA